ncbi:hypothetical protein [Paenibacillus periandrae]|uniref:hypothetical protein n=1 Tax=Paenibacillus periandrae TaxID=1761741 RepID=UPI001F089E00|nr:hypothetical protein [Paenibacillus periandrae]
MIVTINEKRYSFTQDEQGVKELFETITKLEQETKLIFDHMSVNGSQLYNKELDLDLLTEELLEIEVALFSKEEQVDSLKQSTNEYVTGATPIILDLSEDFYRTPSVEAWNQLTVLFDSLGWVSDVLSLLEQNVTSPENIKIIELKKELIQNVEELQEALNNKDHIMIGDILKYETSKIYSGIAEYTQ